MGLLVVKTVLVCNKQQLERDVLRNPAYSLPQQVYLGRVSSYKSHQKLTQLARFTSADVGVCSSSSLEHVVPSNISISVSGRHVWWGRYIVRVWCSYSAAKVRN